MAMPKPSRVLTSSERSSSVELAKISTEGSQPNASVIALRTAARVSFGQSSQLLMRRRSTGEGASSDIIEAKFQTFSAAFAHRSLEPVILYCQASDNYI